MRVVMDRMCCRKSALNKHSPQKLCDVSRFRFFSQSSCVWHVKIFTSFHLIFILRFVYIAICFNCSSVQRTVYTQLYIFVLNKSIFLFMLYHTLTMAFFSFFMRYIFRTVSSGNVNMCNVCNRICSKFPNQNQLWNTSSGQNWSTDKAQTQIVATCGYVLCCHIYIFFFVRNSQYDKDYSLKIAVSFIFYHSMQTGIWAHPFVCIEEREMRVHRCFYFTSKSLNIHSKYALNLMKHSTVYIRYASNWRISLNKHHSKRKNRFRLRVCC